MGRSGGFGRREGLILFHSYASGEGTLACVERPVASELGFESKINVTIRGAMPTDVIRDGV